MTSLKGISVHLLAKKFNFFKKHFNERNMRLIIVNQLLLLQVCQGLTVFDPQNMEHMEQFLKSHTPQRNDFLNFINPGKPS